MIECPKCGKRVRWSWGQDTYAIGTNEDWEFAPQINFEDFDGRDETDVGVYQCPCGKVLGVFVNDSHGLSVKNIPEFADVNWEATDNEFYSGRLNTEEMNKLGR